MNKKGFTLIELLAVVAILAILAIIALPNILELYKNTRKNAFLSEVQSIYDGAYKKYMLSQFNGSNTAKVYTNLNSSRKLDLQGGTGGDNFKYCVNVNVNGEITNISVTNGTFKYESNSIMDHADIVYVNEIEEDYTFDCDAASAFTFVSRQNEGSITVGDEVAIDTEHFYVINSNSTNTLLLAKYNLLVGDVYNSSDGGSTWTFTKTLSTSDTGYGLQSASAKGYYGDSTADRTGVVAFSGKGYWDNSNCVWSGSGYNTSCPGTTGLKSEYANTSNTAGTTSYTTPYPYVYNSSMSSIAPTYGIYGNPWRAAQDNEYTIAYYVERYINTLKGLGAPSNVSGRLLTYEEASSLSNTIKGTWSYWLGSALSNNNLRFVRNGGLNHYSDFWSDYGYGVRPVIVVSTSDIES